MQLVVLWLLLSLAYCSAWSQLGAGASGMCFQSVANMNAAPLLIAGLCWPKQAVAARQQACGAAYMAMPTANFSFTAFLLAGSGYLR
jgi:hypothetical protein